MGATAHVTPSARLREEAVDLLRRLIRVNTVNPPGNETAAAELLRDHLAPLGVECTLLARVPERANLVARIPGRDPDAPRLLLLSHTDTVPAEEREEGWSHGPWSGDLEDGEVWGRGALDMKGQVAASAAVVAALAREGFQPEGDLLFAATADEEVGAGFGLSWLCSEHPEAVRSTWCVNEGGGDRVVLGGRAFYLCATSEKASSPFRLRVRGRSGHAAVPALADNALVKAAPLIAALAACETPLVLLPETERLLLTVLGRPVQDAAEALEALRRLGPAAVTLVEPMLRATVAPTGVEAWPDRNVIPSTCEVMCECRIPPGQDRDSLRALLVAALGEGDWEIDWLDGGAGGSRSSFETPLWQAVEDFVAAEDPSAAPVPTVMPGFTDSHYLREAFGTVAYGFFPARTMSPDLAAKLIHSTNERIAVDDLEFGARFLLRAVRSLLSGPGA